MQLNRILTPLTALADLVRTPNRRSFEVDLEALVQPNDEERAMMGLWVADGGTTRLALRPNGRYDKRLAAGEDVFQGRYEVDGSRLYFESDSGKVWTGKARSGALILGDHRFVRLPARRAA